MIRTQPDKSGEHMVRVTFALTEESDVSVAGDFNDWDPSAHPLRRRSNGTRSAAITVPAGTLLRFRYVSDGYWFDEPDAWQEPNGMGGTNSHFIAA